MPTAKRYAKRGRASATACIMFVAMRVKRATCAALFQRQLLPGDFLEDAFLNAGDDHQIAALMIVGTEPDVHIADFIAER